MQYLYFTYPQPLPAGFPVCVLSFNMVKENLRKVFLNQYGQGIINDDELLAMQLHRDAGTKKVSAARMKEFVEHLAPILEDNGVQYVICTDSAYFKVLTQEKVKASRVVGYVYDSPFGKFKVIYAPSAEAVFYDPVKNGRAVERAMQALASHAQGTYQPPGTNLLIKASYPPTDIEIHAALDHLLNAYDKLYVDIEAFSLKHYEAGVATIAFSHNETSGVSFAVDYLPLSQEEMDQQQEQGTGVPLYGKYVPNEVRREMLAQFFERFAAKGGKVVFHGSSYDLTVLIYVLFMEHLLDTDNLLYGLEVLTKNFDDTRIISYLALNSCAGNELSLKDLSQEFTGNYAQEDINDVRRIPLNELLEYNLIDTCATCFVDTKYRPIMERDDQLQVYESIFKPALKDIIQMQLTGMPINMATVAAVKREIQNDYEAANQRLQQSQIIQAFVHQLNENWVAEKNAQYKKKRVTLADAKEVFNPNSGQHLIGLLYTMLELPILEYTDTKQPATGGEILKALGKHTQDPEIKELLDNLRQVKSAEKILNSFIPAMEAAPQGPDGWHYLMGSYTLGGTVSGRLSSSNPNMQNLPANSKYGKLIKTCFEAPPGFIFGGLDFASLEDRISALTTKDPNKLKVYTDGFDGHCLRAYAYFSEDMPDIDGNSVSSINSIESKYKPLRQDSKAPTFALTYQGTYITLMKNCGFSEEKAKKVEDRYRELYKVSIDWVQGKLDAAMTNGYVTVAFGMRVRTPLLAQVVRGTNKTPYEAEAEGRTAGNALGQSWCLLNSRAASEFMSVVRAGEYRTKIRPCAQIHDAQYYLVPDDLAVVAYVNKHLVKAVEWQDHPDIQHDQVKLGGKFSIFYPNWSKEIIIPNGAGEDEILNIINKALNP